MSPVNLFESKAIIKVLGVGGGGCNAVSRMVEAGFAGVDFIAINTDLQALRSLPVETALVIGGPLTKGQGAGGDPTKGEAAAKESEKEIAELIAGADLVFVAAGMGGGTGTGAAPVVARLAKNRGIITVAVVTTPFGFEGPHRRRNAEAGLAKLAESVDAMVVIPNENLLKAAGSRTTIPQAFLMADETLQSGVLGISSVVLEAGQVNRDFADVANVLRGAGTALMGLGRAVGDGKAKLAAEMAVKSPLLSGPIQGVKRMLVNFSVGPDFTLHEQTEAMEYLNQFLDPEEGQVFLGIDVDDDLEDEVRVTLIAAGMGSFDPKPLDKAIYDTAERSARRDRPIAGQTEAPRIEAARSRGAAPGPIDTPLDLDEIRENVPEFLRSYKRS